MSYLSTFVIQVKGCQNGSCSFTYLSFYLSIIFTTFFKGLLHFKNFSVYE